MKAWLASFCVVAFFSCTAAFAQETNTPTDPAKIALATKILEVTHALDNMSNALVTMIVPMVQGLKQQAPSLSDNQLKMISDMLLEEMRGSLPKMMALNTEIYARHFTLDELKAIEAFYETPAGRKIVTETPKIVQEVVPIGMAWGRQAAQDALTRITQKLREQGVKI